MESTSRCGVDRPELPGHPVPARLLAVPDLSMTNAVEPAMAANLNRYTGGEVVADYLHEPYHRLRQTLAVRLLLAHFPRPSQQAMVADLGAGSGEACLLLSANGLRVIACDADEAALRAASAHAYAAVNLDAGKPLPFRSGTLDGILAGELVEHLFDTHSLLAECRRVLRPGGVLVVTTPNLATLQDRLRFLAGRSPRQVNPFHEFLWLHIRPFTASSLDSALRQAGFTPVRRLSNYVVWYFEHRRVSLRWMARWWPSLGGSLIVAAVRPADGGSSAPG